MVDGLGRAADRIPDRDVASVPALWPSTETQVALAGRVGLGSNTRSIGLGDMGSELCRSFEEAFFDYPGSFWNADWKHMRFAGAWRSTVAGLRRTCSAVSPLPCIRVA